MRAQSPDLLYQRRARSVKARMTELNEMVVEKDFMTVSGNVGN